MLWKQPKFGEQEVWSLLLLLLAMWPWTSCLPLVWNFFFLGTVDCMSTELSHLTRILLVWVNSVSFLCGGGGWLGNGKGQAWLVWIAEKRTESYRKKGTMLEKNESLKLQC